MSDQNQRASGLWLKRFTLFTAVAAFVLIWIGGLVTSHDAGLAVPDWPTTYGQNMFLYPVSKWVGNILYEHGHRLAASAVGFFTTIVLVWAFVRPAPRWLRTMAVIAFLAVVSQGVLGGLRVIELKDVLGVFHATLAQLFFLLVAAMALFQTEFWRRLPWREMEDRGGTRALLVATTAVVLGQLMLGATMRHQHAGLSIPDFPAAYGKLWPDTSPAAIQKYNQMRIEVSGENPITAAQVIMQMAHRISAVLILTLVTACLAVTWRRFGPRHWLTRGSAIWLGLVIVQAILGATTIWTGKTPLVATAHVACGALCLVTGGLTSIISFRLLAAPVVEESREAFAPPLAPSAPRP